MHRLYGLLQLFVVLFVVQRRLRGLFRLLVQLRHGVLGMQYGLFQRVQEQL